MVFISFDITQPNEVYTLSTDLHFTKIKVVEFIIPTNNINIVGADNILMCMNDYNDNHFIFPSSNGNSLNTQYLADIPFTLTQPISYSPVNMVPADFYNYSGRSVRFLRVSIKHLFPIFRLCFWSFKF